MKQQFSRISLVMCILGMVSLILDSACAARSVQDAINLCINTVIPSLFPLFVLSGILVGMAGTISIPFLVKFCRIPPGSESIFLLGLAGGFPMGAQCIVQAMENHSLSPKDAQRMLGFCNNCGPAFIFGILGSLFQNSLIPLALLLIQAESAIMVAAIWPGKPDGRAQITHHPVSVSQAVTRAVRSMVSICAWVILAKVILGFVERWLFPFFPVHVQIFLAGILELTGGCLALYKITSQSQQLLLCCIFICFGGICVLLQIHGITAQSGLAMGTCVRQKLTQALIGAALGCIYLSWGFAGLLLCVPAGYLLKNAVENSQDLMYNTISKGGI